MILVNLGHVASIATEKRQRKRGWMCREARTLGFTCIKASRPGAVLREGKAGDKHMPSSVSPPWQLIWPAHRSLRWLCLCLPAKPFQERDVCRLTPVHTTNCTYMPPTQDSFGYSLHHGFSNHVVSSASYLTGSSMLFASRLVLCHPQISQDAMKGDSCLSGEKEMLSPSRTLKSLAKSMLSSCLPLSDPEREEKETSFSS